MPEGRQPRRVTYVGVGGQGQWMRVPGCNGAGTAEKSYPVRGQERRPGGATLRLRSGCGREELPQVRGQGRQLGGAIPLPRPGAEAGRTNPTSKEPWLRRHKRAERSYPPPEARGSGWEELPHTRGPGCCPEDQPQVQGAVAAWAQEGLEELTHVKGLEGWQ